MTVGAVKNTATCLSKKKTENYYFIDYSNRRITMLIIVMYFYVIKIPTFDIKQTLENQL